MKSVGIIAEYNPFHKGHMKQIEYIQTFYPNKPIVVIMSGNFVQRGEPAIFNKWIRTKAALMNGVAMVIELPVVFAVSSAEFFASYALSLLDAMAIVDTLCFGSECGDINLLKKIAEILSVESSNFKMLLKTGLKEGLSFPKARYNAMRNIFPESENILFTPNNILAIEYLKALKKTDSKIKPFTLKRQGEDYHSLDYTKPIASAKAIRHAILNKEYEYAMSSCSVPNNLLELYRTEIISNRISTPDKLSPYLQYAVKTLNHMELSKILDVDEGLENRIVKACGEKMLFSEILSELKSKRYTYTKLSRALIHIVLKITKQELDIFKKNPPYYIRVLGFRKEFSFLLKEMKKHSLVPLVLNLKNAEDNLSRTGIELLKKEILSTDIYNLTSLSNSCSNYEYTEPIITI